MKKAIIFDFDNTLVQSLVFWKKVIDEETAKHFLVGRNLTFTQTRAGLSNLETAKYFIETHSKVCATEKDVINFWYSFMEQKYLKEINFVSGAEEFLKQLKKLGYKLALATATGKELLLKAFKKFKIEKYFDLIICEEEVGKSKKYPNIYLEIFKKLEVLPQECLYFEDSLIAVKTASSLGVDCVAIINDLNKKSLEEFNKNCVKTIENYNINLIEDLGLQKENV